MQTEVNIKQYLEIAEARIKQLQKKLKDYLEELETNPNTLPIRTAYINKISDEMKPLQTEVTLLHWVLSDRP